MRIRPSTSQNSTEEPSWSLIRLVSADGDQEEQARSRRRPSATTVPAQTPREISSALLAADRPRLAVRVRVLAPVRSWALAEISSARSRSPASRRARPRRARSAGAGRGGAAWRSPAGRSRPRSRPARLASRAPSGRAARRRACARPRPSWRRRASSRPRAPPDRPRGASRWALSSPSPFASRPAGRTVGIGLLGGPGLRRVQAALGHPALEALDAPTGVHQLLPARVERVAVGAHLDVELLVGGARDELVAARAAHVGRGCRWGGSSPSSSVHSSDITVARTASDRLPRSA